MDAISKVRNVTVDSRTVSTAGGYLSCTNLADNSTCSFSVSQEVGDAVEEGKSYSFTETWSDYVAPEAAQEAESASGDHGDEQQ